MSALKVYKDLEKELGLSAEVQPSTADKLAFVNAQIDEMKRAMFRSALDVVMSERLSKNKIELLAAKGTENMNKFKTDVKQFKEAIETLLDFKESIENEG